MLSTTRLFIDRLQTAVIHITCFSPKPWGTHKWHFKFCLEMTLHFAVNTGQKSHYPQAIHHAKPLHFTHWCSGDNKVAGHQHRWLAGGYDLEIYILEVDNMVVSVFFFALWSYHHNNVSLVIVFVELPVNNSCVMGFKWQAKYGLKNEL